MTRFFGTVACVALLSGTSAVRSTTPSVADIDANDNRTPAGALRDGVLRIALVAGEGIWYPEAEDGPGRTAYAFGEEGQNLLVPGPLVRVPAGTEIVVTLRNTIGQPLIVRGLHDRPGRADTLHVAPNATRTVRFRVHEAGTYFYWASTGAGPTLRDRWGKDGQLNGALIVDPPGARRDDHVFMIGIDDDEGAVPAERPLNAAVINGRSWPNVKPLSLRQGDTLRARWINASDRPHPLHLHGFYYRVTGKGDIGKDTIYTSDQRRQVVTELMVAGQTMSMSWVPERPGNWLMHCHMSLHMDASILRRGPQKASEHGVHVMAGLITGFHVLPRDGNARATQPVSGARRIRLLVQSTPNRYGSDPGMGFVIQQGARAPRADSVAIPGAPLLLTRGEPVQITVVNRLNEPTSVHWHGIELDSYYDGVAGWGGDATRTTPHVPAHDSLTVHFTPPRAGTFIYHTHFSEERQLASGLYGPLIVLEPGQKHDPASDLTWVIGQAGPGRAIRPVLNGSAQPVIELQAGRRYRIRLINIATNVPLVFSVAANDAPVRWRAIAKDGADLPIAQAIEQPAQLRIGVGEAYDFEFTPDTAGELKLQALDPAGVPRISGVVRVR